MAMPHYACAKLLSAPVALLHRFFGRQTDMKRFIALTALTVLLSACALAEAPTPTLQAVDSQPTSTPTPIDSDNAHRADDASSPAVAYEIIDVEDASHKALEKALSAYSLAELEALPLDKKMIYRVVAADVTEDSVRSTIVQIIDDLTGRDQDIDEITIFLYSDAALAFGAYDLGTATWAPGGELGNMTPRIAETNDRSSYQTTVKIRDGLDSYLAQRGLSETKFGMTEEERRALFKEVVAAEDRGQAEADEVYSPLASDIDTITKNVDMAFALQEQYRAEVRAKYGITPAIWLEISIEAFNESWPLE